MVDPTYTQQTRTDGNGNPYSVSIPASATTPVAVPPTAPTGQVSTNSAPAVSTPTAVVSTQPAVQQLATIKSTATSASDAMKAQTANNIDSNYYMQQGETLPAYNSRVAAYNASKNPTPTPPPSSTPAQDALKNLSDIPDLGNQFLWNDQGSKIENPVNSPIPQGYSTRNPTAPKLAPNVGVIGSTTDSSGNVINQYQDGTYGKINTQGAYMGPAQQTDFVNAQHGQVLLNSILNIQNSPLPLTDDQKGQVAALNQSFLVLIKNAELANANLVGGTTIAMNLYGMGNSVAGLGEITGAIQSGMAKIGDLQAQAAGAVSKMMSGFATDNLKLITESYDIYSKSTKEISDNFNTQKAQADKAIMEQQNSQRADQTIKLQAIMNDATISNNQKMREISQSTLDQRTKDDIAKNSLEQFKLNIENRKENFAERQANNSASANSANNAIPSVPLTAQGAPDASKQATFLANIPGGADGSLANQIKNLAAYQQLPSDFSVRLFKGSTQISRADIITLVKKYDPSYDENLVIPRQKIAVDYSTTGKTGKNIIAINTAMQHAADLDVTMSKLNNGPVNLLNTGLNFTKSNIFGQGNAAGANINISAVADELATALTGKAGTDATIKDLKVLDSSSSPDKVKQVVGEAVSTLGARLGELTEAYSNPVTGMGKPPKSSLLYPGTQSVLAKLQSSGYPIRVPGFDPEATTALDKLSGTNSNDSNSSSLDAISNKYGFK